MSSTNKTPNLRLNEWIGSDVPCRTDFVGDNQIIDTVVGEHCADAVRHITDTERQNWNAPFYVGSFMGNGASSRLISLETGFVPKWGLIFPVGTFPSVNDYDNKADYNYFGVLSNLGSTSGLTLNSDSIRVTQSTVAVSTSEYKSYNENGITYVYILFR